MAKLAPPPHAALVLEEIQAAGERFTSSKADRIRVIRLGRAAGLTWQQIAQHLGITDASCIQLAKRAASKDGN